MFRETPAMLASLLAVTLLLGCDVLLPVTPVPLRSTEVSSTAPHGDRENLEPTSASTTSEDTSRMACTRTFNRTSPGDHPSAELVREGTVLIYRLLTKVGKSLQTIRNDSFRDLSYRVVTQDEDSDSLCSGTFETFLTRVCAYLQNFTAHLAAIQDQSGRVSDFSVPLRQDIQGSTESLKWNVRTLARDIIETTLESSTASPSQLHLRTTETPYHLDLSTLWLLERYQFFLNATKTVYVQLQRQISAAESQ